MHELVRLWWWFQYITGTDNTAGRPYGFWSGFGSDIGEMAIAGAIYKKLNCHQPGCWRIGLHPHGHLVLCRRHHPKTRGK